MTTRTIVLWDIDNTLLYTAGAGRIGLGRAFRDLYGVEDAFRSIDVSGRTDSAIFRDAAIEHGLEPGHALADLPRFIDLYIPHLEAAFGEVEGGVLKPGVPDVLRELGSRSDVVQGLGTGNFREAARAKLRHFAIAEHFPACDGGFGDDAHDRAEVIRIGIERLVAGGGVPRRIVVVGDTPHDVSAAKANGAVAVAVATGRDSAAELLACGADVALDDLADVERALRAILG